MALLEEFRHAQDVIGHLNRADVRMDLHARNGVDRARDLRGQIRSVGRKQSQDEAADEASNRHLNEGEI